MAQVPSAISEFWILFRQRAADLAATTSAESPVYDALLEQLHKIDPGLYLEVSVEPGTCELIVTAEGDRSLFPLAHTIVAAAPVVEGWMIRALKPKLGFPESVRWENLDLRIADIVFDPLELEGSDDLGLRIFVPGVEEQDVDAAHSAVLRAMDHGLGEERLAMSVHATEVRVLSADVAADDLIPLVDLDAFIQWRESRRKGGAG